MYVTLAEIKRHLIVEHDLDDTYLESLGAAAEDAAGRLIDRKFSEIVACEGELPPSLRMLVLQLVGTWYANRETVEIGKSVNELPHSLKLLADLNRYY